MPVIPVNLADVKGYAELPVGEYSGQIDQAKLRPATQPGKFDQLMVTYIVIDGEFIGQKSSEFLSFSPNAANRLKNWFKKFGLENLEDLVIGDETDLLEEPDLVGLRVIFRSRIDGKKQGSSEDRYRTELVTVDEDEADLPGAQAAAPTEPEIAETEEEIEEVKAAAAPARTLRSPRTAVAEPQPKRRNLK